MLPFITQRVVILAALLIVLSIVSFILIELPPGDFLTTYVERLKIEGYEVSKDEVEKLSQIYGLDQPAHTRYLLWVRKIVLRGDFGRSLQHDRPVNELIKERLLLTVVISLCTMVVVWLIAVPIGVFSATRQYSFFDYFWTFVGVVGLGTPNFLLALLVMWLAFLWLGISAVGIQSPEFISAPWSVARVIDLLKHAWVPVAVIALTGTAGMIRITRGTLLDELRKAYVIVARAKGLGEGRIVFKYSLRIAINPLISTIGWMLPTIFSGEALVSIVLNLHTIGPLLLQALLNQDMFLAGSIVLILGFLTLVGTLVSDIMLVWVDPRIRFAGVAR